MVINGRVRQACSALVDRLLEDNPEEIELRPGREVPGGSRSGGRSLADVSGPEAHQSLDSGRRLLRPRPRPARVAGSAATGVSAQRVHELRLLSGSLPAIHENRTAAARRRIGRAIRKHAKRAAYDRGFIGAAAISQAMLFNMHPTGKMNADERLEALMDRRRPASVRQRPKLRGRVPEKHSAHPLHRPRRPGHDRVRDQEAIRFLIDRPGGFCRKIFVHRCALLRRSLLTASATTTVSQKKSRRVKRSRMRTAIN